MELSDSKIKKISFIFSKESSSYIFVNCTVFSPSSKIKKIYAEKEIPYISENGTFKL